MAATSCVCDAGHALSVLGVVLGPSVGIRSSGVRSIVARLRKAASASEERRNSMSERAKILLAIIGALLTFWVLMALHNAQVGAALVSHLF